MIELPLALTAGLLGSSHCLGMCGPFVLTMGAAVSSPAKNIQRQLVYSVGRIFTYATLGSIAGFGGEQLIERYPQLTYLPALLAALAGALLLYQGLFGLGILRGRMRKESLPCLQLAGFSSLLTQPDLAAPFLAGILTGFLPCGLLYGMLALAGQTGSLAAGALLMIVFGSGTVPLMLFAGWGGTLLDVAMRRRIYRIAAWCVVITGAMTVARGAAFLYPSKSATPAKCPFCLEQ